MNSKRILFVIPNLGGGGAERVVLNLANELLEKKWHVIFLLGQKSGEYLPIVNTSIPIYDINANSFFGYVKGIGKFIENKQFDFVFSFKETIISALLFVKWKKKLSFCVVSNLQIDIKAYLCTLPFLNRAWLTLVNKYATKANIIIAASNGVKKSFVEITGCNPNKISILYNAIGKKKSFYTTQKPTDVDFSKIIFINVGRITYQKDQTTLLKAFAILKNNLPSSKLVIVGKGDDKLEEKLKLLAIELNINDDVDFIGFKSDVYNYYAYSDVFVLSSTFEGFGNVIPEAMSFGITIVSTNCPSGPSEILHDGTFGYLCEVGNVNQLAAKMVEAYNNPIPKEKVLKRAQDFHTENIINQFEEILLGNANK